MYSLEKGQSREGKRKRTRKEAETLWALMFSYRDDYILFTMMNMTQEDWEILRPDRHAFI